MLRAPSGGMIEFAAGLMVGGSVGAVIMGALLAQTRAIASDVRQATRMQAHAMLQAPRQSASQPTRQAVSALSLLVPGRAAFASASSQLH